MSLCQSYFLHIFKNWYRYGLCLIESIFLQDTDKEEEKAGPLVPLAIPALPGPEGEAVVPAEEEPAAEEP